MPLIRGQNAREYTTILLAPSINERGQGARFRSLVLRFTTKSVPRRDVLLVGAGLASVAVLWQAKPKVAALAIDPFLFLAGLQACLCAAGAALVWNRQSSRATFWIVIGVAALLRLSLLTQTPTLSDDIYRYIWDGRVQAAGINPYRYIPADPHLAFLRDTKIYPHINRRNYAPTIYPPGAQMFYFAVTRVSESIVWFKTVLLIGEGLTIWLLARLLVSFNLPRERVLIYAWNPLVLWEFSSGHIDFVMTTLVVLALYARRQKRETLTGIFLGGAVLVKFLPLAIFPALFRRWSWRMPLAAAATICLGYAPYLGVGAGVFGFLPAYTGEEGMGDGRFFLLLLARYLTGGMQIPAAAYLILCFVALLMLTGLAVWRWNDFANGFLISSGVLGAALLFILSPQFPWYWIWLTPLLVFLPRPAIWPFLYVSCGALLQYGKWFDDWRWLGINPFLARDILQFVPAALMLFGFYLFYRRRAEAFPLLRQRPMHRSHHALGNRSNA